MSTGVERLRVVSKEEVGSCGDLTRRGEEVAGSERSFWGGRPNRGPILLDPSRAEAQGGEVDRASIEWGRTAVVLQLQPLSEAELLRFISHTQEAIARRRLVNAISRANPEDQEPAAVADLVLLGEHADGWRGEVVRNLPKVVDPVNGGRIGIAVVDPDRDRSAFGIRQTNDRLGELLGLNAP